MKNIAYLLLVFLLLGASSVHDPDATAFVQDSRALADGSVLGIEAGEPVAAFNIDDFNNRTIIYNATTLQNYNNTPRNVEFGLPLQNEHNFIVGLDNFEVTDPGSYNVRFTGRFKIQSTNRTGWVAWITVNNNLIGIEQDSYCRGANSNLTFSFDFVEEIPLSVGDIVRVVIQRPTTINIDAKVNANAKARVIFKKSKL